MNIYALSIGDINLVEDKAGYCILLVYGQCLPATEGFEDRLSIHLFDLAFNREQLLLQLRLFGMELFYSFLNILKEYRVGIGELVH